MVNRDASITVRVAAPLKKQLETAAEAEGRSLSNLILRILEEWADKRPKSRK